jgi:hypothetical protein
MVHILGQESFESKVSYFEGKQKEITEAHDALNKEKQGFELWVRETAEFKKIETMERKAKQMAETYKAELKAWSGITDGENANILDLLKTMKRIQNA